MRAYGNVWREAQTLAIAYGLENARLFAAAMVGVWSRGDSEEGRAQVKHWRAVLSDLRWIVCYYDPPPVPARDHDWHAHTQDYDGAPDAGAQDTGNGRTEREALQSLFDCIADSEA